MPVVLIFNKTDLLDADERHYQEMMVNLYETVGYQCFQISAETGEGIEPLRALLKDKVTLLSGNSGVGKSTLLNLFVPNADARVADISDAHDTGMHTTTFSEMVRLPEGGWLIDTPGIKGFGSFDMEPEEIGSYFKEIFKFSKDCRFSNCTHTHEPGCAVRKAGGALYRREPLQQLPLDAARQGREQIPGSILILTRDFTVIVSRFHRNRIAIQP